MLCTTYKKNELSQFGPFYYAFNKLDVKIEKEDTLMLFKGYLYPDINEQIEDLFSFIETFGMDKGLRRFKGLYCG